MPFHWGPNGYSKGDSANELSSMSLDPNAHIQEDKAFTADIRPGRRPRGPARRAARRGLPARAGSHRGDRDGAMSFELPSLLELGAAGRATRPPTSGYEDHPPRMGFFTDTSLCIGCKACEVACKEWNQVPEDGLELHGHVLRQHPGLSADTWRHVAFIEQRKPIGESQANMQRGLATVLDLGLGAPRRGDAPTPGRDLPRPGARALDGDFRWLMSSDVCKHCTDAACLDVCPTGALFRTEFGTVVVQEDVCNGCGYCVPACPYGVIDKREQDGRVCKCTLCYDRLGEGMEPACAKACPTNSIQFGELDELRERAGGRVEQLHEAGVADARCTGTTRPTGSAGTGPSSCCSTSPRSTGCRRTRS